MGGPIFGRAFLKEAAKQMLTTFFLSENTVSSYFKLKPPGFKLLQASCSQEGNNKDLEYFTHGFVYPFGRDFPSLNC